MQLNEYQRLARRTQNAQLNMVQRKEHALMGMMSELGEIAGIYQKVHQGHMLVVEDVIDELGDLMWFVAEFCDVLRADMGYVAERNIDKLKGRYPEGFAAERSLHRRERAEGDGLRLTCYGDQDSCGYFREGLCDMFDRACADVHADVSREDGEE